MAATSRDVAQAAGVSQGTVSRALRGLPGVTDQTRDRVRRAAAALNYVPIEAGRSLRTRRTHTIGIITADLTNPFYPELIEPMRAELEARGLRTVLIPDSLEVPVGVDRLINGSLDGVIITTVMLGSDLPYSLKTRSIPFILVNREVDGAPSDVCTIDNRVGAARVADLLAELGHRNIAAIFGPTETSTSRDREAGLRQQLGEHGITLPARNVRRGQFAYATGHAAMLELLDEASMTAVFCANDVIALGACNAAVTRGIKIGTDITIVGFDDITMAAWDVFRITTIGCDLRMLAQTAVELLTKRIQSPDAPRQRVVLQPELILRSSHGPPRL